MPSLKQYLQRLGSRPGSPQSIDAVSSALREGANEQKRTWKELERLRKTLELRFGTLQVAPPSPPGSMAGLLRRLHQQGPRFETVIDIGASDGRWTSLAMQSFPLQRYLLIEAQPVHDAALRAFAQEHPNVDIIMAAAGAALGEIYFDASDPFGGQASSIPYPTSNITVPVISLDHEVAARQATGPFLLKFDTHGFEMQILAGAVETLQNTAAVIMECYNFRISPDCIPFPEMCLHMQSLGFRCVDLADVMYRERDGALWQMDLVFVRSDRQEFQNNSYR